ncbi:MAG TPA: hypothetical protein VLR92_11410 [Blastocatellia bacterium]|nr:hypothetical protein [Blastocatellia bacterium]
MIEHVPPGSRSGHLRTILGVIERLAPGRGTTIADLLNRTAELLTRRGIVVLISDLYDEPERVVEGLEHLRFRGNDVIVFHVMDKQELEFDFIEPVVLEDAETEEQLHVLPDVLRDEYLRAINAHIDSLREGAARNRIDYEIHRTSDPLDAALFAYLARRSQFG